MQLQPQEFVIPGSGHTSPEEREADRCEVAAQALRDFGRLRFRAQGTSMLPAIWPGDILTVVRATEPEPKPQECWLTLRGGGMVAHRVVGVRREGGVLLVSCRGDFLDADDPETPASQLLGRVTEVERYGTIRPAEVCLGRTGWAGNLLRRSMALRTLALRVHAWRASMAASRRRSSQASPVAARARVQNS